ncbi:MAG: hypothetical protein GY834_06250 [Bacteroidetes bacterium]|nr:hypothetical protein [Bacteroidota bacterium]
MTDEEKLDILVQGVANEILLVTPIIGKPNLPSFTPLGCGLNLKINNNYYLISAGHLLNNLDRPDLLVPGNDSEMVLLNGKLVTTFEDSSSKTNIDYAVLRYSQRQIEHIVQGEFTFIKPNQVKVNHQVEQNGHYVIAGYPVSGVNKIKGKSEFRPRSVTCLTYPLKENKYNINKFDPNKHILVKYQRKIAPVGTRQKQITKEIRGISGSGLWFIPNWNDRYKYIPKYYLVGILIENFKDKGFLVALRIDYITETIYQLFKDKVFPRSKFNLDDIPNIIITSDIK